MVLRNGEGAVCMRVHSDHVQPGGGWFHRLDGSQAAISPPPATPPIPPATRHDLGIMAQSFASAMSPGRLQRLAQHLGVSAQSLERLDTGWDARRGVWTCPMRYPSMQVCGISLRPLMGKKFSMRGGTNGLFIPRDLAGDHLFVCEGPTDTAAMLDLGFAAIGRPSCSGGVPLIVELLKAQRIKELTIVADGDEPGQKGAEQLARAARLYCVTVKTITPPLGIKDARAWKLAGATSRDVQRVVANAYARRLQITLSPIKPRKRQHAR
jgi:hypothetical protein